MARTKSKAARTAVPGDVLSALEELGFGRIKVANGEAQVLCPYHDDNKIGSFSVNLENGKNNCFSCESGGSFAALVKQVRDCSWIEAKLWCQTRATHRPYGSQSDAEQRTTSGPVDTTTLINEASLALYVDPPYWARLERGISLEACQHYGVLWDDTKNEWILPVRDPDTGKLWGWQRKGKEGTFNEPKSIPKSRTLLGIQSAEELRELVLVESPLDVLCFHTAGIPGAVSSFGVQVSQRQLELIAERLPRGGRLVLALDNDEAGDRVSERLCRGGYDAGGEYHPPFNRVPLWVFNYGTTGAKDPGELAHEYLAWGISSAIPAFRARF